MILHKDRINELPNFIQFYQNEHENLSIFLIKKLSQSLDFKIKIQKASIQLVKSQPFAVIGLRRKQESIFLEFYNKARIENCRIIKTIDSKNGLIINRVNIASTEEIDRELQNWIIESSDLLS